MNFYLTFGQRYRQEQHPSWPEAHPDGYVRIVADSELQARALAFEVFGHNWSFIYSAEEFDDAYHIRGEIGLLLAEAAS